MSETENIKILKDIAVEHFKIHADQRLKFVHFFVILYGLCISGYAAAWTNVGKAASFSIALFSLGVCFLFWKFDCRTKQIVKISESAISLISKKAKKECDLSDFDVIDVAENKEGNWSYSMTINILYFFCSILSVIGMFAILF